VASVIAHGYYNAHATPSTGVDGTGCFRSSSDYSLLELLARVIIVLGSNTIIRNVIGVLATISTPDSGAPEYSNSSLLYLLES
jgi:hypothetical protein